MGVYQVMKDWPLLSYGTVCCCIVFLSSCCAKNVFIKLPTKRKHFSSLLFFEAVKFAFSRCSRSERKQSFHPPGQPTVDICHLFVLDCSFFFLFSQCCLRSFKCDSLLWRVKVSCAKPKPITAEGSRMPVKWHAKSFRYESASQPLRVCVNTKKRTISWSKATEHRECFISFTCIGVYLFTRQSWDFSTVIVAVYPSATNM